MCDHICDVENKWMDMEIYNFYFIFIFTLFFCRYRSLAYFKKVRILVPSSWNSTEVASATWERYENSDVRISPANENFPYTEKFTGCGLPGKFIGLTPDYITNQKVQSSSLHDVYGTPNKVRKQSQNTKK